MLTDFNAVFLTPADTDSAEDLLGMPTLGHLPEIDDPDLRLICDNGPFSLLLESLRSLRTNIHFVVETPLRSLVITSAVPAEGKSTVAANLAMATAMRLEKNRVIVLDADLRKPTQHVLFKTNVAPGLTELLRKTHPLNQVLHQTVVPNVQLISSGSVVQNPLELLESEAMVQLIRELEDQCDLLLIDASPMLVVADPMVLAPCAGGVLLVIGHGETQKKHTQKAIALLSRSKARVIGTVFNRMSAL
jgi:capsular exopolysaccharide synthesis family protein